MAALTGGEMCKYLMFVFNFIFWIAGTGVMAVGLWLRFDPKTKILFEGENSSYIFYTGVYILIAVGVLMMVVGFFGCCGAIRESPCMLGLFFFFLLVIFAVEVAAGIWAFSNQTKVTEDVTNFYKETYNNYQQTKQPALKETLSLIQHGLNCCGPSGNIQDVLDETCPGKEVLDVLITKSCPDAIDEVFNSKLHIIGSVGISIGVFMIFGMIFSMMLCCAIRKTREIV
ncbi:CD9 antigen-like isoform X1 [Sinocyclocheilus rhinocerous]|uniref:Tetraspanin n=1 Tax=Sinocyclocheilus rhinocerous TaxID=307959 RepID=A0A673GB16_9TELE|nr:PREDICTED: CD9 antigen-like isoform X1 [Sinocyclocheilus rhinocerous]